MATSNPYSDSLLMDALRGSLSNAESFGRGFAVAPVGLLGDIEGLLRKGVNFSFGRGGVNVGETPVLPTTEGLLSSIPRMTAPRMETAGMEQIGSAANPRGPLELAKGVGRVAGNAINEAMVYGSGPLASITPQPMRMISQEELSKFKSATPSLTGNNTFDPRFDDRILEQERLKNLTTTVIPVNDYQIPKVSLADYAGYPFITSMADRSGTGLLTEINRILLNNPVERQGGQNYMFENPNQVWASGDKPVKDITDLASILKQTTGRDPLYIPWIMSPSGGDFANMTGETMLSYAQAAMSPSVKSKLDKRIKNTFISDWKGLDDPASLDQFRSLSDTKRKLMKQQLLDKEFRNEGGLSLGEARLAIADPNQLTAKDASIMNIGQVFADQPIIPISGHRAYPRGVAGQGLGVTDRDLNVFQLLQQHSKNRGIIDPTNPPRTDIRTLEMKPYGGLLTDELLKQLGY
jgi:hypothetical protein